MANEEQLAILKQGVEVWNKWREENPEEKIDLRAAYLRDANLSAANLGEADLISTDLSGADLSGANLSNANLSEAYLIRANLYDANLKSAKLFEAYLNAANLREADLSNAILRRANLSRAFLNGAILSGAYFSGANLYRTDLSGANLSGAYLSGANLVETNLTSSTLTGCNVYGISAWNLELEGAEQSNLVITRHDEPTVMVDNLEVAQFIHLLLNREKLRDVLNTITKKGVLILGRFRDGGLDVLQGIAESIRKQGYLPMLFDFEASDTRDFTETVKIMVGLSRFVIVDLSGPSVPKELEATVPDFEVPFIPVIEKGREFPSMTTDLAKFPWFRWPPVEFANKETLLQMLPEAVIAPAEEIGKAREERRAVLFPEMGK